MVAPQKQGLRKAGTAECWLTAGGAHHTVMSTALGVEAFADLAELVGIELAVIDRSTSAVGFARELRWNAAYYKLASGI